MAGFAWATSHAQGNPGPTYAPKPRTTVQKAFPRAQFASGVALVTPPVRLGNDSKGELVPGTLEQKDFTYSRQRIVQNIESFDLVGEPLSAGAGFRN